MSIDLEGDLRREFDAATPPSGLAFHPESVLRQGSRTIRRRRIAAGGSAAMAIVLVGTGVGLLNLTHDSAAPQPAAPTATSSVVRTTMGLTPTGTFQIELNRDAKVTSNVKLFFVPTSGPSREVGTWSTTKPGQKPDATWKSGMVDGHPFTVGLIPGTGAQVKLVGGDHYNIASEELKGTGYTAFAVDYRDDTGTGARRPVDIASISWSGPTGIVDGIEGDHRLTGRMFTIDAPVSVKVMLRPGNGGRTTVFGSALFRDGRGFRYEWPLSAATTDASGAAVVTGRLPNLRPTPTGPDELVTDGAPIAAGVLPAGATNIGVELTTNEAATGLAKSERLPDGRVIFVLEAKLGQSDDPTAGPSHDDPSKDSIKAITWTNADGSQGRKDVTQKQL